MLISETIGMHDTALQEGWGVGCYVKLADNCKDFLTACECGVVSALDLPHVARCVENNQMSNNETTWRGVTRI